MANKNVWLFYPNILGYMRVVLAIGSFYYMKENPLKAALFYGLSASLDAFDGFLARAYNQCSRFGAMLDQLTDRCALLALVMALGSFYPQFLLFFQLSAVIDISSHWLHLHASDISGKTSHKDSDNSILHLYYTSRKFLFFMCLGNEAFYSLLYINYFWSGPGLFGIHLIPFFAFICFPVALVKTVLSVIQLLMASHIVVEHDVQQLSKVQ